MVQVAASHLGGNLAGCLGYWFAFEEFASSIIDGHVYQCLLWDVEVHPFDPDEAPTIIWELTGDFGCPIFGGPSKYYRGLPEWHKVVEDARIVRLTYLDDGDSDIDSGGPSPMRVNDMDMNSDETDEESTSVGTQSRHDASDDPDYSYHDPNSCGTGSV